MSGKSTTARKKRSPNRPGGEAPQRNHRSEASSSIDQVPEPVGRAAEELVPYDEGMLEQSRTQWQLGDWESLAQLQRDKIHHHPERIKLVLLAAAGRLQQGNVNDAKQFIRTAQDWGCTKKLLSQILIASVYNSLGRSAAIARQEQKALSHFEMSVSIGTPGGCVRLLKEARMWREEEQIRSKIKRLIDHSRSPESKSSQISANKPDHASPKLASDSQVGQKQKFSSDADIDDFINDIAPFFQGRSINYVDVGAYTGEVLLKILSTRKIKIREAHLFEPNPESYQKLKLAVKDCPISSCNTYHLGISNVPGKAMFRAAKSMTKKVNMAISVDAASNLFEIECKKLDDFGGLFTDGQIGLLKLDVEGEEIDALKSADALLRGQKIDVLYVEVGMNREGVQQTYFGTLDDVMQGYGYRVFKIYEQKNEWIEDSPVLRRCNAAYMSSRFATLHPYNETKIL